MRTLSVLYKNGYNRKCTPLVGRAAKDTVSSIISKFYNDRSAYSMTGGKILCQELLDTYMNCSVSEGAQHDSYVTVSVFDKDIYANPNLEFNTDITLVEYEDDYEDGEGDDPNYVRLYTTNDILMYIPSDLHFGSTISERRDNMKKYLDETVGDMSEISPYDTSLSANGKYNLTLDFTVSSDVDIYNIKVSEINEGNNKRKVIDVDNSVKCYTQTVFSDPKPYFSRFGSDVHEQMDSFTLGYYDGANYIDEKGNVIE